MTVLPQTEEQFQQAVIQYAEVCGWRCYHTRNSKGSEPGFPDLVLMRRGEERTEIVVAELKSSRKGIVTQDQAWWLDGFRTASVETYLWTPEDWPEINRVLPRRT